jgi:mannosyltransferase OCH1-like enzyme
MIPRLIHQSWKTDDIPERWRPLQESWQLLHPNYEYHYWTDRSNREFIAKYDHEFIPLYDSYPLAIERAELARYLILYHLGGLYVDMDFEALRPVDKLLCGADLVFGLEPDSHAHRHGVRQRGLKNIVCNAFMASTPLHPFWPHFFALLQAVTDKSNVLDATGTFALTRACNSYARASDIVFVPTAQIYPLDNDEIRRLGVAERRAKLENSYAMHHWSGSWWRESLLMRARERVRLARQESGSSND